MRLMAALALFIVAPSLAMAEPVQLAAHRATYTLTLDSNKGGDVNGVSGTMAYEVTDACDGWAVRQRLDMTLSNRDGQDVQMVSDYLTWESKDGTKLRFHMKQTTDTAVTEQVEGDATLAAAGDTGEIHYTMPEDKTVKLPPGTLFPMSHTAAIITAAQAGKKFLTLPLFDGTGPDGAQNTSIFISSWTGPSAAPYPQLAELPSGRVRVAFFSRAKEAQSPDYEVGMRYWSNGVADELNMDFGDFAVTGKLATFTMPASHC
ncbi:cell envelope integrity EipB family protein [Acidisphaera sp. L21]|uniref:cell envelope integrity EipB family protein n=1 Tax=Acidisphaera sp. L21 TaxID=1641851 RepID=UPI0020B163C4|nr:cell envelope integrity EipB family protein [Acidisphaera sp. L21]